MSTKRSVILRGCPEINEYGVASAQVKPGYLVKGVSTIAHQTANGAKCVRALALERDELGQGIDNTLQGSGTSSAYYASGDTVKVGVFDSGDEATGFVASGAGTVNEDTLLSSAGDGTFKVEATPANAIARSLETVGSVTVGQALRVQFI